MVPTANIFTSPKMRYYTALHNTNVKNTTKLSVMQSTHIWFKIEHNNDMLIA